MHPVNSFWNHISKVYKYLIHIISGGLMVCLFLNSERTFLHAVFYFLIFFISMHIVRNLLSFYHELGHLVFGLLSGYRFAYFQLLRYRIQKRNDRFEIVRKNSKSDLFQCIMAPPDTDFKTFPVRLFFLGGYLMVSLFILLFLSLAFLFPSMSLPRFLFLQFVLMGSIYVLIGGLPTNINGSRTDTYNALTIPKDFHARCAFFIPRLVTCYSLKNIRLRDMPEEWFYLPSPDELTDKTHSRMCSYYIDWLMDQGKFAEADEAMDYIFSHEYLFMGPYALLVSCNKIYLILVHTKKYEQVKFFYNDFIKNLMVKYGALPTVKRTQYIIALLYEKDMEKAAYLKSVFLASKSQFYPTEYESELELIEIAEACAKKEAENIE